MLSGLKSVVGAARESLGDAGDRPRILKSAPGLIPIGFGALHVQVVPAEQPRDGQPGLCVISAVPAPGRRADTLERDQQHTVVEARVFNLDEIGKLETAIEGALRDAAMQISRLSASSDCFPATRWFCWATISISSRRKPATASVIRQLSLLPG